MRLLYFYGRVETFDNKETEYLTINFSREYDFEHAKENFFKPVVPGELDIFISCSEHFLPSDFWSNYGNVYNCTVFVGGNGSGKTTIIQNLITNILYIDQNIGNDRLVVIQDGAEIHALAITGDALYHGMIDITESFRDDDKPNIIKLTLEDEYDLENVLNNTRMAYLSNTFSKNDLLNNVLEYTNVITDVSKRETARSRFENCVKNYSLVERIKSVVLSRDMGFGASKQLQLFWYFRYKNQAEFVFSSKAKQIRNKLSKSFNIPIPNSITIRGLDLLFELTHAESKIMLVDNYIEKLYEFVRGDKKQGQFRPNGSYESAFLISVSSLFRIYSYTNLNNAEGFEKACDIIIKNYEEVADNSVLNKDRQLALLDEIEKALLTIGMGADGSFVANLKSILDRVPSIITEDIKKEIDRISNEKHLEKKVINDIANSHMLIKTLYMNGMIKEFNIKYQSVQESGSKKREDWELSASTDAINEAEFAEFINAYNATLQFTDRQYLAFSWGLSSGEENVLDMLSYLYELRGDNIQTLQIYLDEADIGYHPEWQRKWFSVFPQMIELLFDETNDIDIQVFLATHSPLLLGDVPSRCAKFVKQAGSGRIVINEKLDDEGEDFVTFGENLYTILRNGFFLEEGTIGEIAINKSKEISEAFRLFRELNKNLKSNDADHQSIIEEIERKNASIIENYRNDSIEIDKKKIDSKRIKSASGECLEINCGAYLYYVDMLISIYSNFIKERLKKEYMDIIVSISEDDRNTAINTIDEQIRRLTKYRGQFEQ